jgi:hydroxylamine reductase
MAKLGKVDAEADKFLLDGVFSTLTNVNFDAARFVDFLKDASSTLERVQRSYLDACKAAGVKPDTIKGPAEWRLKSAQVDALVQEATVIGDTYDRQARDGKDVVGLQDMITFGLKGTMAYMDHARRLGRLDATAFNEVRDSLASLADNTKPSVGDLVGQALQLGATNLKVLALLSDAHTSTYGHPVPTRVPTHHFEGKAILISGHDLKDLEILLQQTEGTGINVYTHGEMLPAHGYPGLKKYAHLKGHYGGAWQLQQLEFSQFKGPIIMTSNCIIEPRKSYMDRIWTTNVVGWPGVKHLSTADYTPVIKQALAGEGFKAPAKAEGSMLTGFGHNAVLGVADKIVDAVKSGAIKHFFSGWWMRWCRGRAQLL